MHPTRKPRHEHSKKPRPAPPCSTRNVASNRRSLHNCQRRDRKNFCSQRRRTKSPRLSNRPRKHPLPIPLLTTQQQHLLPNSYIFADNLHIFIQASALYQPILHVFKIYYIRFNISSVSISYCSSRSINRVRKFIRGEDNI